MLQPVFPMFSSGITASAFASANVPGEDRFCCLLEDEDFSLVTLGECIPGDTFSVLYYQIQFTHPIALKSG